MKNDIDVYEDNAGSLRIYFVNSETGMVYWGAMYTDPEQAASDFVELAVKGHDPVEEGWECGEFVNIIDYRNGMVCRFPSDSLIVGAYIQLCYDYDRETASIIASRSWYRDKDADMLLHEDPEDFSGVNASTFARAFLGKNEQ